MKMMPSFYQEHLQSQLTRSQYLLLSCLIHLLQTIKQVRLEALATALPLPITFESRRRKLQRFLKLPQLTFKTLWFPLILAWIKAEFNASSVRLRRNEQVQLETQLWVELAALGVVPGTSLYLNDVQVTHQKGFGKFNRVRPQFDGIRE